MRLRPVRGTRRGVAVASVLVLCLGWLGGCAADSASSNDAGSRSPEGNPAGTTVRVLQMNLCNSGRADCYSGGLAVRKAVALVHHDRPTMVSVNEVCRGDVGVLEQALSTTFPAGSVATAFTPARDRPNREPVRCQNGQQFGDGVLVVVSSGHGVRRYGGLYPMQDGHDVEERGWACLDLAAQFTACTTHTASTSTTVALAQCRHLLGSVVPRISRGNGGLPVVLGADLNLAVGGSPGPQSCLPSGYGHADDGALQDVVLGPGGRVRSHSIVDMRDTTDHPGLLVDLVLPHL
jgi:hypothetical protein